MPYRLISRLAKRVSRPTAYAIARYLSSWAYRGNRTARTAVATNLRVVLSHRGAAPSEAQSRQLVRLTFVNFGKYVVDFFQMGRLTPAQLNSLVREEPNDYLAECRALNRGVIGITAHIGNWELGANVMEQHGCPVTAVVRQQPTPKLDELFQSRRRRRGIHVLPLQGAARAALAGLRRNEFVALLADLDFSNQRRPVPFFGKPALLPAGPAVLAARSGAPLFPAFVLRQPDDTFLFRTYPPIIPGDAGSVAEIQQRICTVMEEVIAEHPDQWFVFEPLWPDE